MKRSIRILLALLILPALAGLFQFGLLTGPSQLTAGGGDTTDPEVLEALQQNPEVAVIINLVPPEDPPGELSLEELQQQIAEAQAGVLADLEPSDFTLTHQYSVLPGLAGRITEGGVEVLDGDPDVISVAIDGPLFATLGESLPLIHGDETHLAGLDGAGVDVAVLDTGIDTDHPDLADSMIGQACFASSCPGLPDNPAEDDNGHGTHVSGIVTANGIEAPVGVAPEAGILAIKVLNADGEGGFSGVAAGLEHILLWDMRPELKDIEFVNMSLGDGVGYAPGECRTDQILISMALDQLRWLYGTVPFAASGNNGSKSGISFPACDPAVVSVGATYDANVGPQAWGRCWDSTTAADQVACFSQAPDDLDVLAPGSVTTSAGMGGGNASKSGTSMASPHAVAVAALLKQARPEITHDELEQVLEDTGVPVTDDYDPQHVRTRPRVDAQAAALAVGAMDSSGIYHVLEVLVPAGQDPGQYLHCLADVHRDGNDLAARTYCYVDIPGIAVNPEAGPESGDGFPYVGPPAPYGDVDDVQAVVTGTYDGNTVQLSGCLEDRDGQAALGNLYLEWSQDDPPSGEGAVTVWIAQDLDDCLNGTPHGYHATGVLQSVRLGDEGAGHDFDHDACPDEKELLDNQAAGGLRDPYNHWDYFNPTHDGLNRVDDILKVVSQYFIDEGNPAYTKNTDRTAVIGANPWNLGPPNGQQRVDDILAAVKSYFHDCSGGSWIDDDTYPN
jgi:subtilisin family serine protease